MGDNRTIVSIIMPVFNAEKFISEAIQSVIAQSHTAWELIIINDGSTDSSEKIIKKNSDDRITYLKQENKGVSKARNAGLKMMKGEFFCFLDADDVFTPTSLEIRLNEFYKDSRINFVDGEIYVTDIDIKNIIEHWKSNYSGINPQKLLVRIDQGIFKTVSWMFRRLPSIKYKFSEEMTHAEDLWFFIENTKNGLYGFCQDPIMFFRRTGQSAMADLEGLEEGYILLLRLIRSNLKNGNYSIFDVIISQFKLMKIMSLSYLSKGELIKAFSVLFRFIIVR